MSEHKYWFDLTSKVIAKNRSEAIERYKLLLRNYASRNDEELWGDCFMNTDPKEKDESEKV